MLILTYQDAIMLLCFRKVVTMTNDIIKKENLKVETVETEFGNAIINWGEGQISLTKIMRKLGKKESDLLPPKNVNSTCTKEYWEELKMLCARSYGADKLALYMQPKQNNPERTEFAPKISSRIGNIRDLLAGKKGKKKKMTVKESHDILVAQESDKMIEEDKIITEAKRATEENGIVFLDEIDKVSARSDRVGGDVSREGVQRDLLPLIEGTTVSTKHGPIKTDHILFIASGAFQLAKPSDLLPELQGRLPIRVELDALKEEDFKRILKEPDNSLIKQYKELLKTENVNLEFTDDGIDMLAKISAEVNSSVENIGARRLHTIIEKVLDDISFNATDRAGETITVNQKYVQDNLGNLVKDTDLSKFIL